MVESILLFLDLERVPNESTSGHGMGGRITLTQLTDIVLVKLTLQRSDCDDYEDQHR